MSKTDLMGLARLGAKVKIAALEAEATNLRRQFPGLATPKMGGASEAKRPRNMSPAARKRISDAAKKRWAEYRKKNKKD